MTEADKLACAERELKTRQQVYPRWVAANKMSKKKADWEIECMTSIVEDYRKICNGTRLI